MTPERKRSLDRDQVFQDVRDELNRATRSFGPMRSAHEGYSIIHEELDELWDGVKSNAPPEYMRGEAIQVAAMAIRFILDITPTE